MKEIEMQTVKKEEKNELNCFQKKQWLRKMELNIRKIWPWNFREW